MTSDERFYKFTKEFVLPHEGTVYENDPDDPGGPTKYGIDHRSHPDVDIKNLTEEQAIEIYKKYYWDSNQIGELEARLGASHYDACINCGPKRAGRFLAAANGDASEYNNQRRSFYLRLVDADKTGKRKKYLKGWTRRVDDLDKWIKNNET